MIKPSILRDRKNQNDPATGRQLPFCSPREKLTIGSLDEPTLTVTAHYNPAEFQVVKAMPWSAKTEQNDPKAQTRSTQDSHEFKGTPSREFSIELLFDNYETGASVKPIIDALEKLSTVRDVESTDEELRRPHYCVVAWGGGINLRCIITSLTVKFTMFASNGTPLRAVCTLALQEANLRSSGAVRSAGIEAARALVAAGTSIANLVR